MGNGRDLHCGSECFISTSPPFCGLFALTECIVKRLEEMSSNWSASRDQWIPDQTDDFSLECSRSVLLYFHSLCWHCFSSLSHCAADLFHLTSLGHLSLYITALFCFPLLLSLTTTPSLFLTLCPVPVITLVSFVQCSRLPHFPQNSFPFVSWKLNPTRGQPAEDRCPCVPAGRLKVTWPCRLLWRVWRVTVATMRIYASGISPCCCPFSTLVPLPLTPVPMDVEFSTACFPLVVSKSDLFEP